MIVTTGRLARGGRIPSETVVRVAYPQNAPDDLLPRDGELRWPRTSSSTKHCPWSPWRSSVALASHQLEASRHASAGRRTAGITGKLLVALVEAEDREDRREEPTTPRRVARTEARYRVSEACCHPDEVAKAALVVELLS